MLTAIEGHIENNQIIVRDNLNPYEGQQFVQTIKMRGVCQITNSPLVIFPKSLRVPHVRYGIDNFFL